MAGIEKIRSAYQGEWLALAVLKEETGEPRDVELVYHSKDRDQVWKRIRGDKRRIYVTYAGPMFEEGYAAAF